MIRFSVFKTFIKVSDHSALFPLCPLSSLSSLSSVSLLFRLTGVGARDTDVYWCDIKKKKALDIFRSLCHQGSGTKWFHGRLHLLKEMRSCQYKNVTEKYVDCGWYWVLKTPRTNDSMDSFLENNLSKLTSSERESTILNERHSCGILCLSGLLCALFCSSTLHTSYENFP